MAAPTYTLATVTKNPDGTYTLGNQPTGAYALATVDAASQKVPTPTANFDGTGGTTLPQTNVADVSAAKRIQVVNDIAASVAGGGQAMIQEPDKTLAGKKFKDNRTANAPYFYECFQEANPSTGATETWWNRFRIQ